MKEKGKIGWKILFWISVIPLVLFLLFMLLFDISGSTGSIGPAGVSPISDWIGGRVILFTDLFPIYIIPLLVDILLIIFSKIMIEEDKS